ncbi:MAG: ankyrin repeat domain-containing protein [Proteobacteria bacterium]|nr:ankyrin repeat domain-containing protein [Pseudomonadota bacterium]
MSGRHPLTQRQKQEQIQIIFVATMAGLAMVLSAAFPLITYTLLSGASLALLISLKQWTERDDLSKEPKGLELDKPSQTFAGTIFALLAVFLLQMNPLSQIIICTAYSAALSAFFIHDCILNTQQLLDKALREACQKGELDKIKTLIARKASPFSQDGTGNNAFHLAVQNKLAHEIMIELQAGVRPLLTIKDFLTTFKQLFNAQINQKWSEWLVEIKKCIKENTQENRASFYEASFNVISAYYAPLQTIINTGAQYLIEQLSFTQDIHAQNKAGHKAEDLLTANASDMDPEKSAKLKKILEELAKFKVDENETEEIKDATLKFSTTENNTNTSKPRPTVLSRRIKPNAS